MSLPHAYRSYGTYLSADYCGKFSCGPKAGDRRFLKKIGFNPNSAAIITIANDRVGKYSLNSLAAEHDRLYTRRFVTMRIFIRKFKANTHTPFPAPDDYDFNMLTKPEQIFVSKHAKLR